MNDKVNHPAHYADNCSIECIQAMRFALGDDGMAYFCAGNAFKYLWRHKFKGKAKEDLEKAWWYISKALDLRIESKDAKELVTKSLRLYEEVMDNGDYTVDD